jgi:hypothetical protein
VIKLSLRYFLAVFLPLSDLGAVFATLSGIMVVLLTPEELPLLALLGQPAFGYKIIINDFKVIISDITNRVQR